jgi:hypothetical protein
MDTVLDDPWIAAQIEAAVAPYVGRLPDDQVAWMRAQLADTLTHDPRAAQLARRARPAQVEESGEVRRGPGGAVTPIGAAKRRKSAG